MRNINGKSRLNSHQCSDSAHYDSCSKGARQKRSKTAERRSQRCLTQRELSKCTYTLFGQQTVLVEREYQYESLTGFLNEDDFKMLQQFSS